MEPQQVPLWLRESRVVGRRFGFFAQDRRRHNLVNLMLTALLLLAAVGVAWLSSVLPFWAGLVLGGFGFGLIYFHLLVLVVHEASHGMYLLHPDVTRRKAWNRLAGQLVCIPFAINYVRHWENGHVVHHKNPMRPGDPQAYNSKTGVAFWRTLVLVLLIPGYAQLERLFAKHNMKRGVSGKHATVLTVGFWIVVGYLSAHFLSLQTFFAQMLGLQVLVALNQFKGALEHGGEIADAENPWCRSRSTLMPLRWLILPYNISLHFEHHLNFAVPWYKLGEFHREVLRLMPAAERARYVNRDLVAQLSGAPLPDTRVAQVTASPLSA